MENTRNKSSESHSKRYQKDYTKLEAIFDAAVKRSRRKKIIYYASDRLYSENSRREIAQNSYKAVAWAEPLEEKDIHTEIIDLANKAGLVQMAPSQEDEKEILAFIMDPDTPEAQKELTSKEVLKALHELKEQNDLISPQESNQSENAVEVEPQKAESETSIEAEAEIQPGPSLGNEQDFLERYYKTKQEVLGKLESTPTQDEEPEAEPIVEATVVEENTAIEEDQKDEAPSEEAVSVQDEQDNTEDAVELRSILETLAVLEEESTEEITEEPPEEKSEDLTEDESLQLEEAPLDEETSSETENVPEEEVLQESAEAQEDESTSPESSEPSEIIESLSPDEAVITNIEEQEVSEPTLQTVEPEEAPELSIEEDNTPEEPKAETHSETSEPSDTETNRLENLEFPKEEDLKTSHENTDINNVTSQNDLNPVEETTLVEEKMDPKRLSPKPEKDLMVTETLTYENVQKDYSASTVSAICSLAVLAIFILLAYQNFLGFDYIALVLTVVGIFLAWDMRSRSLIFMCIIMLFTLIACMMIWVNQTRVLIDYIHYFWFFLIPLCMGVSYAYFNSKKALDNFSKETVTESTTTPPVSTQPVPAKKASPEKIDLKTIINDISEDESGVNYDEELSTGYSPVSYPSTPASDTSDKSVNITIDSTPNWGFYQLAENPDLLNYEASLEDYIPSIEEKAEEVKDEELQTFNEVGTFEESLPEDEDKNTMNIPPLSDFISVDKFGLSEEELNESLKTQDTGPVVFNNISQVRPNEYFEIETEDQEDN